jgi:hypothetical protein
VECERERDKEEMTSPYLDKFRDCMQAIADMVDGENDAHRKAVAANFLRHAGLEFSGQDELILTPEMTVDNPIYHVKWGPDLSTYEGMDEVQGYYNGVNEVVCTFQNHTCWVNDWGIASYSTFVRFTTGDVLAGEGMDITKPDETECAQLWPMAMFWSYNEEAKLIGEDVYMLYAPDHRELSDEEKFKRDELAAVAKSFVRD